MALRFAQDTCRPHKQTGSSRVTLRSETSLLILKEYERVKDRVCTWGSSIFASGKGKQMFTKGCTRGKINRNKKINSRMVVLVSLLTRRGADVVDQPIMFRQSIDDPFSRCPSLPPLWLLRRWAKKHSSERFSPTNAPRDNHLYNPGQC